MNKFYLIVPLCFLTIFKVFSQSIINDYFAVTAVGTSSATVTNLTGVNGLKTLAVGDTILIIQMQGATIDESNSASFGTPTYANAGNHEINVICSIDVPTKTVFFYYKLVRSYTPITGSVQIVTHADGKTVNYSAPSLTATAWNGTTGGVLFIKASGTVNMNGNFDVSAKGFRGGQPGGIVGAPSVVCNKNVQTASGTYLWSNDGCTGASETVAATNYYYPKLSLDVPTAATPYHLSPPSPATKPANLMDMYRGAWKGEGIAQYITDKETGRGAQANGGGGGQTHNSGAGGGGNFGAGGIGGKPWDLATVAVNGGVGGRAMALSALKVFMGGGGGGGHGNYPDGNASPGGNGGGIIIVKCSTLTVSGSRSMSSNGASDVPKLDGDSEGGGGAGGSIYLDVTTINNVSSLTFNANGGKGGDAINAGDCIGTGGGGGGGYIYSKASLAGSVKNLAGGANGLVTGITNTSKPCSSTPPGDPTWGAMPGSPGSFTDAQTSYKITQSTTLSNNCSLPVELSYFGVSSKGNAVDIRWTTASEKNNDHFLVERSKDGINFETMAVVQGAGNSAEFKEYKVSDYHPLDGLSFYRLKQVDIDGSFMYSPIKSADAGASELSFSVYPQPSENRLVNLNYYLKEESIVQIKVLSTMGEEIYNNDVPSGSGSNSFSFTLTNASPGLYFIYLNSENGSGSGKIIVR